jgi:hypothetical protein
LDEILKLVDPELYSFLVSKELKADVYAMPRILFLFLFLFLLKIILL